MNTLTIQKLLGDLPKAKTSPQEHLGYKHFLDFFTRLSSVDSHAFVISACFAYSWMPRMLSLDHSLVDASAHVLDAAKRSQDISSGDLALLVRCINRSLVGASKLLHFASPSSYPIWDSRVFRYIHGRSPKPSEMTDIPKYLCYRKRILRLASDSQSATIRQTMSTHIGYDVTTLRALEVLMYLLGAKK